LIFNNSCIFERKKSAKYRAKGNTVKCFTFLEEKPWLDVLILKSDTNIQVPRGDLLVIQPVFKEILSVFLDSSEYSEKPYGFLLLIDGLINEMDSINYNDIIAINTWWNSSDLFKMNNYFKINGEKIFQKFNDNDPKFNEIKKQYVDLKTDTYKPRLKNRVYSYLFVEDYDDNSLQKPESRTFCGKREGEYITKKFDFDEEKELITLVQKSDTIQRLLLNLDKYTIYKNILYCIIDEDNLNKIPEFFSCYIDGNVINDSIVHLKNIVAVTTFTNENEQLVLRFYKKNEDEDYLQEIKELKSDVDHIKNCDYELLYKTFFPNCKFKKTTIIELHQFIISGEEITKINNEFPKNYDKYIKSKKNK
jgi:hypothetical protein